VLPVDLVLIAIPNSS